jgi:superfamily II DNA or RNA helicase
VADQKTTASPDKIKALRAELIRVEGRREQLLAEIARLERAHADRAEAPSAIQWQKSNPEAAIVEDHSPPEQKIRLFRLLFRGREDVFARRFESRKTGKSGYQPACANEWRPGVCFKPKVKCANCMAREHLPMSDTVIEAHLRGYAAEEPAGKNYTIGVYPMLPDETCWFLAFDFDKKEWEEDIAAFRETCDALKVPVAIERSRSGNGAHAWIFFRAPVPCVAARKMGASLLTETMEQRPEIHFNSYDRLFPNQDTLPKGGLGNLIALPLQKKPRSIGNSVFLDADSYPYADQWAFLSALPRMSRDAVEAHAQKATETGRITGVRMPVTDENADRPWEAPPSRRSRHQVLGPFPQRLEVVLANHVFVPKKDLSPSLRNAIVRIAAFQNPEFYQNQAMRMPVWNTPRIISCAENYPEHIALPRGCLDELEELLGALGIKSKVADRRFAGEPVTVEFVGSLYADQERAANALLAHDYGVLSATTAFGKTVVAASVLSKRAVNTLVLVHRRQLLDQWVARLSEFLEVETSAIGQIGAGKRKPTGIIDVAIIQSLCRKGVVDDCVADYGHLIFDECHHVSAPSFEAIAREFKGKYVTGLSATVARKDGHHPIIFMNCGPIRYSVSPRTKAQERPFDHKLIVRETAFRLNACEPDEKDLKITEVYQALIDDEVRNAQIITDVFAALQAGRSPLVLTERRKHLEVFETAFSRQVDNLIVFKGGMKKKELAAAMEQLESLDENSPLIILATGKFLGEGFDYARLDTLFLALPISWRGTLAQYAGRLHRLHERKREVIIYDYADMRVPILARMFERRLKGYRSVGYEQAAEAGMLIRS